MGTVRRFEELDIWQMARQYAKDLRSVLRTECFRHEFGLKEQMKNASGSIMDNIAEGFGRGSKYEFINFLTFAKGSSEETRSQLYRCFDDHLIPLEVFNALTLQQELLVRKIAALINYLNLSAFKGQKFKYRDGQ